MQKYIFGIKIDDITLEEAVMIAEDWLEGKGQHYIVTPNPEMIVLAQKDLEFKKILNSADLSIPDGTGLKLTGKVKNTLPGVDLMEELIRVASEKAFTVGFLGGTDELAKKAAECLIQKYHNLKISFAYSGGDVSNEGKLLKELIIPKTDLLFVAFGHGKQEKWISANLNKIPVKVAMGVGGAFDYFSGKIPRAPKWVRNLGLEWLFRLIIQPWRIKRQLALLKFLWLMIN